MHYGDDLVHVVHRTAELVAVLADAVAWQVALEAAGEATASRWQTRMGVAAAVLAALATARQHVPEQLQDRGLQRVFALLGDEAYPARVQAVRMVPVLLRDSPRMLVRPSE